MLEGGGEKGDRMLSVGEDVGKAAKTSVAEDDDSFIHDKHFFLVCAVLANL